MNFLGLLITNYMITDRLTVLVNDLTSPILALEPLLMSRSFFRLMRLNVRRIMNALERRELQWRFYRATVMQRTV